MELKIVNKTFGTVDYVEIGEYDINYVITDVIKELGERLEEVALHGRENSGYRKSVGNAQTLKEQQGKAQDSRRF